MTCPTTYILPSLCLIMLAWTGTGCSYLDEDIHLSDEAFTQSVSMEGTHMMGSLHTSGCGGGHWGHSSGQGGMIHKRTHARIEQGLIADEGGTDPAQYQARAGLWRDRGAAQDEEEPEESVEISLTNHALITQIATRRAH